MRTIADVAASGEHSLAPRLHELAGEHSGGIVTAEGFVPWAEAIAESAVRVAALRELLAGAPDPHVGVLLPGIPEYLHLLGAAACSELVVVGLNSTRHGDSLARDVDRADCHVVLTDTEHAPLLDAVDRARVRVVDVGSPEWAELLARHRGAALPDPRDVPVGPDDLVTLVFTSGTSGEPKAVRVTQAKIAVPGRMLAERFGIGASDCVYSAMPLFHSNAVMVAWPIALVAGCRIALRRRFSASAWLDDVRRFGCTFANYVGTPLAYVLATPERPDDADNPMRVVYGNEAPPEVRREFARRFDVRVVDGFGSSEGGVSVTRTPETPDDALGPLPAGVSVIDPVTGEVRPRAALDADGRPVSVDAATGELVADGPGMFAGYHRDPAADAERMRGGRFHTGDLAYVDEAGFVYFAGRTSGWMRVDGENLAAAPVERAVLAHPDVAEVGVFAVPATAVGGSLGDAVGCAVVLRPGVDPGAFARGFRAHLAARSDLAPRQWPRLLRVTGALPRTASFKLRARDLTALAGDPGGDRVWLRPVRGATPPAGGADADDFAEL